MAKIKGMKVAIVKWKDHTSQDAWIDAGEEWREHAQLHTIISIGWLKEEDDEKIVLVSAVDYERDCNSCIQVIGKAMVIEIRIGGKYRGGKDDVRRERPARKSKGKDLRGGSDAGDSGLQLPGVLSGGDDVKK